MKKLWIYIFFSPITKTIQEGKPMKDPYVWSLDAPDPDYNQVTDVEILLLHIKDLYYKYEVDGIDYFRTIRAQLVLDHKQGSRTDAEIFGIEQILNPVIQSLILGDWMTSAYLMSLITPTPPLEQALYDEINLYIINYIANNY